MVTHYDEKGKIFTQVISKQPVVVRIKTSDEIIRGSIHIRPGTRIKDELNHEDCFIAVTDAVVFNDQNEEQYRSNLIVLNKSKINWVIPEEEFINN